MQNKFISLIIFVSLLMSLNFAQTSTKDNIVNISAFIEDGFGPIEGKKRVILRLFDGVTQITSWAEDHQNINFVSGNATIPAGQSVSLNSTLIGSLNDPTIHFQIDGIESIFQFKLTAAPYAIDMPSLRNGSQGVTLNSLAIIPIENRPFIHKDDFDDGTLDMELRNITASRLVVSPISDLSFIPLEHLKLDYQSDEIFNLYSELDLDNDKDTGLIHNNWLQNPDGGGGGAGGGKTTAEIKEIVQDIFQDSNDQNQGIGISMQGKDGAASLIVDGDKVIKLDVADPTITVSGVISGAQQMVNLTDTAIATTFTNNEITGLNNLESNTGTFAGNLSANNGSFTNDLRSGTATFTGALNGTSGTFTGTVQGSAGTFTNNLSADSGIFNGNVETNTLNVNQTSIFNGLATFNGGSSFASDRRIKESIVRIDSALELVNQLTGHYYYFKTFPNRTFPTGKQIGFIAQEVEKVLPELVLESGLVIDGFNVKTIKSLDIIPLLVEAIKEQQQEIETLKVQVQQLIQDRE